MNILAIIVITVKRYPFQEELVNRMFKLRKKKGWLAYRAHWRPAPSSLNPLTSLIITIVIATWRSTEGFWGANEWNSKLKVI